MKAGALPFDSSENACISLRILAEKVRRADWSVRKTQVLPGRIIIVIELAPPGVPVVRSRTFR